MTWHQWCQVINNRYADLNQHPCHEDIHSFMKIACTHCITWHSNKNQPLKFKLNSSMKQTIKFRHCIPAKEGCITIQGASPTWMVAMVNRSCECRTSQLDINPSKLHKYKIFIASLHMTPPQTYLNWANAYIYRADSRFAPSQWEMVLLRCNNVSHWLGASLESALFLPWQFRSKLIWT